MSDGSDRISFLYQDCYNTEKFVTEGQRELITKEEPAIQKEPTFAYLEWKSFTELFKLMKTRLRRLFHILIVSFLSISLS